MGGEAPVRSPLGELLSAARTIARPRNDPSVPYVAARDTRYGTSGGMASGVTGDPTSALEAPGQSGTLFAITDLLATSTAALAWHMHKLTGRPGDTCDLCGMAEDAPRGVTLMQESPGGFTHPALEVWRKPNNFMTQQLFVESIQQHQDLVGESWWVVPYLAGRPIELWPVRPDRMAPVRDPQTYISGYVYRSPDGQLIPLRLDEVVTTRTPAPWDSYRGYGAAQTILSNLYGQAYAAEWNRRFFENSALPGGIVEMPVHLQDPEWEEFQLRWAESHRGVRNAHTVAVLEHGAKWIDTKYTMRDMEFTELRKVGREETREAYGIHGHMLGLSEGVNRANADAGERSFARWKVVPRGERIKDALNGPYLKLFGPAGKGVEFAYINPVPADRAADDAERLSKAQALVALVTAGANFDDACDAVGLPRMRQAPKPAPVAPAMAPGTGDAGAPGNAA